MGKLISMVERVALKQLTKKGLGLAKFFGLYANELTKRVGECGGQPRLMRLNILTQCGGVLAFMQYGLEGFEPDLAKQCEALSNKFYHQAVYPS